MPTVLQMQGAERPSRAPLTLFTFDSPEAVKNDFALGCDADVGGTSTVHLDFDDDPARLLLPPAGSRSTAATDTDTADKRGAARFHGHMHLAVRPGYEQRIRGGYAGFRNKVSQLVRFDQTTTRYIRHPFPLPPPTSVLKIAEKSL